MANWQRTLDISNAWQKADKKQISTISFAKTIIKELKQLTEFTRYTDIEKQKLDLIDEFEDFVLTNEDDEEFFDNLMEKLYDWADTSLDGKVGGKKACWIRTF